MKQFIYFIFISGSIFLSGCFSTAIEAEDTRPDSNLIPGEVVRHDNYTLGVYDFEGIAPLFSPSDDTTYVINFWATWCKPCIKELPYFERVHLEFQDQPVRVILVSLDMREQAESKLIPFIISKNITAEVLLLDDPDANSWIGRVDEKWSGAIPATLFINKKTRIFKEKEFEYEDLKQTIQSII